MGRNKNTKPVSDAKQPAKPAARPKIVLKKIKTEELQKNRIPSYAYLL